MGETGDDLRSNSDDLLATLDELDRLERKKRALSPGDQRVVELSTAIELLAARALRSATVERELAQQARAETEAGEPRAPRRSIDETQPRRPDEILRDWRHAVRRSQDVPEGSPEARALAAEIRGFREEYRRATEAATGNE